MNLDAAWTDAILTTASLGGAAWALSRDRSRWITPAGLAVLGVAAAAGTLRFGGVDALVPLHDALSRWAGLAGLPLAALGLIGLSVPVDRQAPLRGVAAALLVGGGALALLLDPALIRPARTAIGGLCMVGCLATGAWRRDPWAVVAPVGVLVGGLGIAGEGEWMGFHRMGWFHLVLATSAVCFARGSRPERP